MINENRLWKHLPSFFGNIDFYQEVYHNARRAKAKEFSINYRKGSPWIIFQYSPASLKLSDLKNLFTLSGSGWDAAIQKNETPAGWGIYSLFAAASIICISSNFGSIEIDTEKWFNDQKYREGWRNRIDKKQLSYVGSVYIKMKLNTGFPAVGSIGEDSPLWAMLIDSIYVNNKRVAPKDFSKGIDRYVASGNHNIVAIEVEPGNFIYVEYEQMWKYFSSELDDTRVIWYGQPCHCLDGYKTAVYDIRKASIAIPVLPTRKRLDPGSFEKLSKKIKTSLGNCLKNELDTLPVVESYMLLHSIRGGLITEEEAKKYLHKLEIRVSRGYVSSNGYDDSIEAIDYDPKARYYVDYYSPKFITLDGESQSLLSMICKSQIVDGFIEKIITDSDSKGSDFQFRAH
jgi:hypothetical protein